MSSSSPPQFSNRRSNPLTLSKSVRHIPRQNPYASYGAVKSGWSARHGRRRSRIGSRTPGRPRSRSLLKSSWGAPRIQRAADHCQTGSCSASTRLDSARLSRSRLLATNQPGSIARRTPARNDCLGIESPSRKTRYSPAAARAPRFNTRDLRQPSSGCQTCVMRNGPRSRHWSTTPAVSGPDPSSATTTSKSSSCWSARARSTTSSASGHSYVETTTVSDGSLTRIGDRGRGLHRCARTRRADTCRTSTPTRQKHVLCRTGRAARAGPGNHRDRPRSRSGSVDRGVPRGLNSNAARSTREDT